MLPDPRSPHQGLQLLSLAGGEHKTTERVRRLEGEAVGGWVNVPDRACLLIVKQETLIPLSLSLQLLVQLNSTQFILFSPKITKSPQRALQSAHVQRP